VDKISVVPVAGRLTYVRPVSVQLVSATDATATAVDVADALNTLSVTFVGATAKSGTSNFRYDTVCGASSTLNETAAPKFDVGASDRTCASATGDSVVGAAPAAGAPTPTATRAKQDAADTMGVRVRIDRS
jgi:hypothetical protein